MRIALAIVACATLPACHVGMVSEWENPNYPIPGPGSGVRVGSEVGGGRGGAVAETDRRGLIRIANGRRQLFLPGLGKGVEPKIDGEHIYFRDGDRLLRRAIAGRPFKDEELAQVKGLRGFEVRDGAALLLAEDGVYFRERGGEARRVWRGTALAIAYEPEGHRAWIAARRPLPAVEALDLRSGEPQLRVPLPLELDDPDLVVVVSSPRLALYIPGQGISRALFIDPETERVQLLGERLPHRYRPLETGIEAGLIASEPPVLEPPGKLEDERMRLPKMRDSFLGRIAALPDGEFVLIDNRPELDRLTISRVDAQFELSLLDVPMDCPRGIDAIGWDERGAYMIADGRSLRIDRVKVREARLSGWGPATRRFFNRGLNGVLVAAEIGLSIPTNTVLCSLIAPFGAVATLFGGGGEAISVALSPLWFPIAHTINPLF